MSAPVTPVGGQAMAAGPAAIRSVEGKAEVCSVADDCCGGDGALLSLLPADFAAERIAAEATSSKGLTAAGWNAIQLGLWVPPAAWLGYAAGDNRGRRVLARHQAENAADAVIVGGSRCRPGGGVRAHDRRSYFGHWCGPGRPRRDQGAPRGRPGRHLLRGRREFLLAQYPKQNSHSSRDLPVANPLSPTRYTLSTQAGSAQLFPRWLAFRWWEEVSRGEKRRAFYVLLRRMIRDHRPGDLILRPYHQQGYT